MMNRLSQPLKPVAKVYVLLQVQVQWAPGKLFLSRIQFYSVKAEGGCYNCISRSQYPSNHKNAMHQVEHEPISNCKSFMPTNELYTCRRRKLVSFAAVVNHGKAIIITF